MTPRIAAVLRFTLRAAAVAGAIYGAVWVLDGLPYSIRLGVIGLSLGLYVGWVWGHPLREERNYYRLRCHLLERQAQTEEDLHLPLHFQRRPRHWHSGSTQRLDTADLKAIKREADVLVDEWRGVDLGSADRRD